MLSTTARSSSPAAGAEVPSRGEGRRGRAVERRKARETQGDPAQCTAAGVGDEVATALLRRTGPLTVKTPGSDSIVDHPAPAISALPRGGNFVF